MSAEPCELSNLLCGAVATCYVGEEGYPTVTDEPGDIWIDRRMSHPYWCTNCNAEFATKEEALEHVKVAEAKA